MFNVRYRNTVEEKYIQPAVEVANRFFHAREFVTSYTFSVKANEHGMLLLIILFVKNT